MSLGLLILSAGARKKKRMVLDDSLCVAVPARTSHPGSGAQNTCMSSCWSWTRNGKSYFRCTCSTRRLSGCCGCSRLPFPLTPQEGPKRAAPKISASATQGAPSRLWPASDFGCIGSPRFGFGVWDWRVSGFKFEECSGVWNLRCEIRGASHLSAT